MPIDSTANLLFSIGADSSDAESNIQAFRALMGKSLSDIGSDFEDWKTKVLGDMSTVEGALTAGAAAIAAGFVAAAGAAVHCADQYAEYVESVAKVSKITGIAVEDVSRLKFVMESVGGSFDTAGQGLAKFTTNVVKAAEGSTSQAAAFARLGITQQQLQAGEHDMLPLLEAVADKFSNLKDRTDRTTEARDLFGRSGAQFLNFLALGKTGIQDMANEADRLGLIVGVKDVEALHAAEAATAEWKAVQEAVDIQVGRVTQPLLTNLKMSIAALIQTMAEGGGPNGSTFTTTWLANLGAMKAAAEAIAEARARIGKNSLTPPADAAPKIEKVKEEYYGLSNVLEQVKLKLAAATSEEAQAAEEANKLGAELAKAAEKFEELQTDPKKDLKDGVWERENAAAQEALKLIPQLYKKLMDDIEAKRQAAGDKAYVELMSRLDKERRARTQAEELEWATEEAERLRKPAAQQAAFDAEMAALAKHLEQIQKSHQTAEERIEATYTDDVAHYAAAEEKKALLAATNDAQRAVIAQQYAAIRAALLTKEGQDLQTLHNSQGWQGVFGTQFASVIKGNEALTREWAMSTNQSLMMVRVTMEGLKEAAQQAFQELSRGMAQNIANAIVYKQSIGDAMRSAVAMTLESLAAESIAWAIYSTALGFTRLAQHDHPGAVAAFTAAAIWGSVGAAAAVAGRAVAPPQSSSTAAASTGTADTSSTAASDSTASTTSQTPHVTVVVQGHLVGWTNVDELTAALNDAVLNKDVTLTATNTKTGVQVIR